MFEMISPVTVHIYSLWTSSMHHRHKRSKLCVWFKQINSLLHLAASSLLNFPCGFSRNAPQRDFLFQDPLLLLGLTSIFTSFQDPYFPMSHAGRVFLLILYSSRWKSYSAPFRVIRCFPRWTRVTTVLTPHVNDTLASVKRWWHFCRRNLFQPSLQRFEWSVEYRLEVTYRSLDLLILSFVESRLPCISESFRRLLKMWIDRIVIITDL